MKAEGRRANGYAATLKRDRELMHRNLWPNCLWVSAETFEAWLGDPRTLVMSSWLGGDNGVARIVPPGSGRAYLRIAFNPKLGAHRLVSDA